MLVHEVFVDQWHVVKSGMYDSSLVIRAVDNDEILIEFDGKPQMHLEISSDTSELCDLIEDLSSGRQVSRRKLGSSTAGFFTRESLIGKRRYTGDKVGFSGVGAVLASIRETHGVGAGEAQPSPRSDPHSSVPHRPQHEGIVLLQTVRSKKTIV